METLIERYDERKRDIDMETLRERYDNRKRDIDILRDAE
jgi:hypothetical protein